MNFVQYSRKVFSINSYTGKQRLYIEDTCVCLRPSINIFLIMLNMNFLIHYTNQLDKRKHFGKRSNVLLLYIGRRHIVENKWCDRVSETQLLASYKKDYSWQKRDENKIYDYNYTTSNHYERKLVLDQNIFSRSVVWTCLYKRI